jgi:hypothetical protein
MRKHRKSSEPIASVLRNAKELATIEQYWHLANRPKSRSWVNAEMSAAGKSSSKSPLQDHLAGLAAEHGLEARDIVLYREVVG